jgi:hypothetical protein
MASDRRYSEIIAGYRANANFPTMRVAKSRTSGNRPGRRIFSRGEGKFRSAHVAPRIACWRNSAPIPKAERFERQLSR